VQEKDANATPPLVRSQLEPQLEAVVLEKVRRYVGQNKVTIVIMKTYLCLRKQRLTGSKQELAERCASTEEKKGKEDQQLWLFMFCKKGGDLEGIGTGMEEEGDVEENDMDVG
jgi:hypothetical protein